MIHSIVTLSEYIYTMIDGENSYTWKYELMSKIRLYMEDIKTDAKDYNNGCATCAMNAAVITGSTTGHISYKIYK